MEILLRFRYALAFFIDSTGHYVIKDGEKTVYFLIVNDFVWRSRAGKYRMKEGGDLTLKRRLKAAMLIFKGKMVNSESFGLGE
jgi:hypothetical protein